MVQHISPQLRLLKGLQPQVFPIMIPSLAASVPNADLRTTYVALTAGSRYVPQ